MILQPLLQQAKIYPNQFFSSQGHASVISKKPNNGWGGGFEIVVHPPINGNGNNGIGVNYTTNWK